MEYQSVNGCVKSVLPREGKEIAERLLALYAKFPAVGFEPSNHYFYNERSLIEKLLQTTVLEDEL